MMKLNRIFLLAVFLSGFLDASLAPAAWSQMSVPPALSPVHTIASDDSAAQKGPIAVSDIVSISISPANEYNREVTVQPDGRIELPLVGTVQAAGITAAELASALEGKYARYVDHPKVTVSVRHFGGRRVAIIGEIRSPGFYEYRDGMKLLDLIGQAGGLTDNAKTRRVSVLRAGGSTHFNFQKVLDGHVEGDLALLPGDTIVVPKTWLNRKSTWISNNILPYIAIITAIATLFLLAKQ